MTADTDLRSRQADLAAQLAAEVRAGRPERARLMAYCGSPEARFVVACPLDDDPAAECLCGDVPDGYLLPDWLAGLERLAWSPPLWVPLPPCDWCGCERCDRCECGRWPHSELANVDPAQWVLAVAACAVARDRLEFSPGTVAEWQAAKAAIEAAEAWTRCPCEACRLGCAETGHNIANGFMQPSQALFAALALGVARTDGKTGGLVRSMELAAQILGPDATREAAARGVLEAL